VPCCPLRERDDGSIHSVLTLGTAQLGSNYGIANAKGMPGEAEARQLLAAAGDAGITSIDTASVYGESEQRIGALLPGNYADRIRVTTKLDVLAQLPEDAPPKWVADAVDTSVLRSLQRLRRRRLDALLLHRWSHHDGWEGAVWSRLLELRGAGLIGTLGASVSYPSEAIEALADPNVGQIQCPVNLLDGRWRGQDFLAAISARSDVIVHARSVLLQGLITLPPHRWLPVAGVDPQLLCARLDELVARLGRTDRIDLAMAYVAALPWVTSLVVGAETVAQLQANLRSLQAPPLKADELERVNDSIPRLPDAVLNPALWRIPNV
jgi:spore coat polysaccharide biosynthesis protein SpsF